MPYTPYKWYKNVRQSVVTTSNIYTNYTSAVPADTRKYLHGVDYAYICFSNHATAQKMVYVSVSDCVWWCIKWLTWPCNAQTSQCSYSLPHSIAMLANTHLHTQLFSLHSVSKCSTTVIFLTVVRALIPCWIHHWNCPQSMYGCNSGCMCTMIFLPMLMVQWHQL